MIAPINSGMQTDRKPWLIPDDAFEQLYNAYVFRGRVRKRFGSRLMESQAVSTPGYEQLASRFRIKIGTVFGDGIFGTAPHPVVNVPGSIFAIGQAFSIGDEIFTVYQTGVAQDMLDTGAAATATYDTTNGAVVFTGVTPLADVYFYPALPVMGLISYETGTSSDELIFGFDREFSYNFTVNGWDRVGTAVWTGSDSQFFWGANWRGTTSDVTFLFVTNYNAADFIKYYDPNAGDWTSMSPVVNNTNRVLTSRIVLPFKDRLVLLNTIERAQGVQFSSPNKTNATTGDFNQTVAGAYVLGQQFIVGNTIFTIASAAAGLQNMTISSLPGITTPPTAQFDFAIGNLVITGNGNNRNLPVYFFDDSSGAQQIFVNRCRFSVNGDPTASNAWIDQQPGLGGYIDAPTKEAIITAQFLKDRLIVYFDSSTWELVYTGNNVLPFVWQKINTELGAESTFSQVPFDKVILGVGNVGVHACNGSNVERIDDKIPDTVFDIHNADSGVERVYGIRDYYVEMVYWSFPSTDRNATQPFNNRVLVYNYKTGSWAINNDSITAFGYLNALAQQGETWQSDQGEWQQDQTTWEDGPNVQSKFKQVIAGNQEGYVFYIDPDTSRNSPAIQITNMVNIAGTITVTAINHNFVPGFDGFGDYIAIENVQGLTGFSGVIYPVNRVVNANTFEIFDLNVVGTYTGGGTCARVSAINILTKQYNFYVNQGRNAFISKVDFYVAKTANGEITVDYATGSSSQTLLQQGSLTGALLGNGVLETSPYALVPQEQTQVRLWHPVYLQADGECVQLNMYLSELQLIQTDIAWSDFELNAMTFYCQPTSSRLQ